MLSLLHLNVLKDQNKALYLEVIREKGLSDEKL